jgi:hypothetical protein
VTEWTGEMRHAGEEVLADLAVVVNTEDSVLHEAAVLRIAEKYSRLVLMRDTLPHALIALQYYTTNPKAKEALAAALRILAQVKGVELPA